MANEDMIIGLKSNCKKGYAIAEFWERTYDRALLNLLKSWRMIDDKEAVAEMAWSTVSAYTHYTAIQSKDIGIYSEIRDMIIPERTYTTKKGEVKTKPEEKVPAHYTKDGDYLNRVSVLGAEPISYVMELQITRTHFEFSEVGRTLRDCFKLKELFSDEAEFKTKDISKAERKASK